MSVPSKIRTKVLRNFVLADIYMSEELHILEYLFDEVHNFVIMSISKDQCIKPETVEIQQLIVLCIEVTSAL